MLRALSDAVVTAGFEDTAKMEPELNTFPVRFTVPADPKSIIAVAPELTLRLVALFNELASMTVVPDPTVTS